MKRVENKFDITDCSIPQIVNDLKLNKLYDKRRIISTYYDNTNFDFFKFTIEGLRPRVKVRIRNYNNVEKYFLEFKFTEVFGKKKEIFHLKNFLKEDKKDINSLYYIKRKIIQKIIPTITVYYDRRYFFNSFGRYTLDTNIQFSKGFSLQKIYSKEHLNKKILEFKCTNIESEKKFNNSYNLKEHSFSKYCEGISLLYNMKY